jgi:hypothetical protein
VIAVPNTGSRRGFSPKNSLILSQFIAKNSSLKNFQLSLSEKDYLAKKFPIEKLPSEELWKYPSKFNYSR